MTVCEEVFHTAGGVAYADLITDGHRETWPIRSQRFRNWVRRCYYNATGTAASAAVIGPALDLLEARAQFDAPERAVNMRVAEHAGRASKPHRRTSDHSPAIAINRNGTPMLVGEIEIQLTGMLSETYIDRPLGSIKLRACFE